jgi:hypothetical protein
MRPLRSGLVIGGVLAVAAVVAWIAVGVKFASRGLPEVPAPIVPSLGSNLWPLVGVGGLLGLLMLGAFLLFAGLMVLPLLFAVLCRCGCRDKPASRHAPPKMREAGGGCGCCRGLPLLFRLLCHLPDLAGALRNVASALELAGAAATRAGGVLDTAGQTLSSAGDKIGAVNVPTADISNSLSSFWDKITGGAGVPPLWLLNQQRLEQASPFAAEIKSNLNTSGGRLDTAGDEAATIGTQLNQAATDLRTVASLIDGGQP